MKKSISTLLIAFLLSSSVIAQVYSGPGGAIQNNGQETYFYQTVSGLPQTYLNTSYGVVEVCIGINHPAVEELQVYLQSPSGTKVELAEGSSCKGADYATTCFSNNYSTSVTLGTAPYAGGYRPIGHLGRFNNGQAGNGTWRLIVKDYLISANAGTVTNWSITFSGSPVQPVSFTSSNLPIVMINTTQPITDQEITVDAGIIYNGPGVRNYTGDPWNNFSGHANMHIRGNSSSRFEKKPYSFETCNVLGNDTSMSLLGMPAENDWILLAMYQDKSLIRVPLTYELASRMGHYAPRYRNVEVMINNEYMGVYALTEKIKRDSNRVDVAKLTPMENSFPQISGGYIFKIDRADEPGWYSHLPGQGQTTHFFYQYVYPGPVDITVQQSNYIASFVDSFETVMSSSYFSDPWIGYQKYVAVPSFVDYFILNELSKNVDAYRLSTYLYKNNISKSGKLHIGPVWDYDLAWHNCNYGNSFDPSGWQYKISDSNYPTPEWWEKFMLDSAFHNALYCRWTQLRQGVLSDGSIYSYIDSMAQVMNESQQRNFVQWPIIGAYITPNPQNQAGATYQSEVNDLKTWVASRLGWLDWAITGNCIPGAVNEHAYEYDISVYPNPGSGIFNVQTTAPRLNGSVLEVYSSFGEQVLVSEIQDGLSASTTIDLRGQPKGIYFYRMKLAGSMVSGKLIIE